MISTDHRQGCQCSRCLSGVARPEPKLTREEVRDMRRRLSTLPEIPLRYAILGDLVTLERVLFGE